MTISKTSIAFSEAPEAARANLSLIQDHLWRPGPAAGAAIRPASINFQPHVPKTLKAISAAPRPRSQILSLISHHSYDKRENPLLPSLQGPDFYQFWPFLVLTHFPIRISQKRFTAIFKFYRQNVDWRQLHLADFSATSRVNKAGWKIPAISTQFRKQPIRDLLTARQNSNFEIFAPTGNEDEDSIPLHILLLDHNNLNTFAQDQIPPYTPSLTTGSRQAPDVQDHFRTPNPHLATIPPPTPPGSRQAPGGEDNILPPNTHQAAM